MRTKRCKFCGAIIYDEFSGDVCDVCLDEKEEEEKDEPESDNDIK